MVNIKKAVISAWIVFHVSIVAIFPTYNYFRDKFGWLIMPYVNALGLHYAWAFYAPNPETAMYIEYEVERAGSGFSYLPTETFYWPPERVGVFDFQHVRRHTNMAFLIQYRDWLDKMLIPWACRTVPNATNVVVKMTFVRVPSVDEVQKGAAIFDPDQTLTERLTSGSCN